MSLAEREGLDWQEREERMHYTQEDVRRMEKQIEANREQSLAWISNVAEVLVRHDLAIEDMRELIRLLSQDRD